MQIVENLNLYFENILSYKADADKNTTMDMSRHIRKNLSNIGLEMRDKLIFTYFDTGIEFLVPLINENTKSCSGYTIKPKFRMVNAVKIRYEGDFSCINEALEILKKYIAEKKYRAISNPYYKIVRDDESLNYGIWDIYISLDSNIL